MNSVQEIAIRWRNLSREVELLLEELERPTDSVRIIAVTKSWPVELILRAYEAGIREFGENRSEELHRKRLHIDQAGDRGHDIRWHLIGPLQSRKTPLAAASADTFHALDRTKIANRLQDRLADEERALQVLIQINLSGEKSKAGLDCTVWEQESWQRDTLLGLASQIEQAANMQPVGLMTIAPWRAPQEEIGSVFQRTTRLLSWLRHETGNDNWSRLSMGMSDDYRLAIRHGATDIRVGRALFGPRPDTIAAVKPILPEQMEEEDQDK